MSQINLPTDELALNTTIKEAYNNSFDKTSEVPVT